MLICRHEFITDVAREYPPLQQECHRVWRIVDAIVKTISHSFPRRSVDCLKHQYCYGSTRAAFIDTFKIHVNFDGMDYTAYVDTTMTDPGGRNPY